MKPNLAKKAMQKEVRKQVVAGNSNRADGSWGSNSGDKNAVMSAAGVLKKLVGKKGKK